MKTVEVGGLTYELTPMPALTVNALRPYVAQLVSSIGKGLKADDIKGNGADMLEFVVPLLFNGISNLAQAWALVDKDNWLMLSLLSSVLHKGRKLDEGYINTHFVCERSFDIYHLAFEVVKYNHFFPWEKFQAMLQQYTGSLQSASQEVEKPTES